MINFSIRFGVPDMIDFWNALVEKIETKKATKDEIRFYKRLRKTLMLLQNNPHHNSLHSHEIAILTKRYGIKVWESYIENNTPAAGRIFWIYYPIGSITIIGIEPHPDDTKHSYEKIVLSSAN